MFLKINRREIGTDREGFLSDPDQWESEVAEAMAAGDGVTLTEHHWEVIRFLRDYYASYRIAPDSRTLVRSLGKSPDTANISREYFATLFPAAPAETACRYAGLPKPAVSACV